MSRRAGSRNYKHDGNDATIIVSSDIINGLKNRIQEIERIGPLEDLEPYIHTLRLLGEMAGIRDFLSSNIRAVINNSLSSGRGSERKLADAAGISNHTVRQWRLGLQAAQTTESEGDRDE